MIGLHRDQTLQRRGRKCAADRQREDAQDRQRQGVRKAKSNKAQRKNEQADQQNLLIPEHAR